MGILPSLGDLIAPIKDLVSEAIVDKDKRDQVNLELQRLADQGDVRLHEELMAQINVNNTEASQRSVFIAGWRPFIGWTGGVGLAWNFVLSPFAEFLAKLCGWSGTMPAVDSAQLMTLVMAMLGVGAMRSYDKAKGTSNDVLRAPTPTVNTAAPASDADSQSILNQLHESTQAIPEKAPWAS